VRFYRKSFHVSPLPLSCLNGYIRWNNYWSRRGDLNPSPAHYECYFYLLCFLESKSGSVSNCLILLAVFYFLKNQTSVFLFFSVLERENNYSRYCSHYTAVFTCRNKNQNFGTIYFSNPITYKDLHYGIM